MARTANKKQAKPVSQSAHSQATTTGPASSTAPSTPEPFIPVPAELRPLTSTLPTNHVYALHIDSNPIILKKRVYVVPIFLNLIITALLAVRVYYAAPQYLDQMITIFGYETAWKVEPSEMSYADISTTVLNRTGLFMLDYFIFGFIGSWPWEFVFGSKYLRRTGPLAWRRTIGFRDTEIIVRRGRKWDDVLFAKDKKNWSREDELVIKVKVDAAMNKTYISKTGYLLLDRDWDLDFKGMIDAHRLVEKNRLNLKDLDRIVLVNYQGQWLLWRVHGDSAPIAADSQDDAKIRSFISRLAELGHEDISFRWIEIVQYETSLPGGFTEERQAQALRELRRMLAERKINDTKFLQDIGGPSEVPGLTDLKKTG